MDNKKPAGRPAGGDVFDWDSLLLSAGGFEGNTVNP